MFDIEIIKHPNDGELVVDSRLIAEALGVEHRSLFRSVRKHKARLERKSGVLRFEIAVLKTRGQPEKYVYLDERQAILLVTLSKNTEQAADLKGDRRGKVKK